MKLSLATRLLTALEMSSSILTTEKDCLYAPTEFANEQGDIAYQDAAGVYYIFNFEQEIFSPLPDLREFRSFRSLHAKKFSHK